MNTKHWIASNCKFAQGIPFAYRNHAKSQLFMKLWSLRPQFVAAAQQAYNEWAQDENGNDEVLGGGGICQDVAEGIANVVSMAGIDATTLFDEYEHHVECVAYSANEAYYVDIPYQLYEIGGGYNWKKIKNVVFEPDNVTFAPTNPPGDED